MPKWNVSANYGCTVVNSTPSVFGTTLVHRQRLRSAENIDGEGSTHFFPTKAGSSFVALQNIPSYTTSLESAIALHQNGCASILKSLTTPLVTFFSVNATGRPSPSSRVRVAKYDHHGWPLPLMPPVPCASRVKSWPVTTNQEAWSWMKMTR